MRDSSSPKTKKRTTEPFDSQNVTDPTTLAKVVGRKTFHRVTKKGQTGQLIVVSDDDEEDIFSRDHLRYRDDYQTPVFLDSTTQVVDPTDVIVTSSDVSNQERNHEVNVGARLDNSDIFIDSNNSFTGDYHNQQCVSKTYDEFYVQSDICNNNIEGNPDKTVELETKDLFLKSHQYFSQDTAFLLDTANNVGLYTTSETREVQEAENKSREALDENENNDQTSKEREYIGNILNHELPSFDNNIDKQTETNMDNEIFHSVSADKENSKGNIESIGGHENISVEQQDDISKNIPQLMTEETLLIPQMISESCRDSLSSKVIKAVAEENRNNIDVLKQDNKIEQVSVTAINTSAQPKFDVDNEFEEKKISSVTCFLCDKLSETDEKPFSVKTFHVMTVVLKCCSQAGIESNDKNYICLFNIHLRNVQGIWYIVDGTELEDSWDRYTRESEEDANDIVYASKNKKTLNLPGSIKCTWISKGHGARGKWCVTKSRSPATTKQHSQDAIFESPIQCQTGDTPIDIVSVTVQELQIDNNEFDDEDEELTTDEFQLPARLVSASPARSVSPSPSLDSMKHFSSKMYYNAKAKLSDLKESVDGHLNSLVAVQSGAVQNEAIIPDAMIKVRNSYIRPIRDAVLRVTEHFNSAIDHNDKNVKGNDSVSLELGWLIRDQLSTAIANFLRIGLKKKGFPMQFLFSKPEDYTLWEVAQSFTLAQREEPAFSSIVDSILHNKVLLNDDMRFRFLVCELLNQSTLNGNEKLLVAWFRCFPLCVRQLDQFYLENSFWRTTYTLSFSLLMEELILILKELNGWPFVLHADFELKFMKKERERLKDTRQMHFDAPISKKPDGHVFMFE